MSSSVQNKSWPYPVPLHPLLHSLVPTYVQLPFLVDKGDLGRQERLAVLPRVTRVWHGRERALDNFFPMD